MVEQHCVSTHGPCPPLHMAHVAQAEACHATQFVCYCGTGNGMRMKALHQAAEDESLESLPSRFTTE